MQILYWNIPPQLDMEVEVGGRERLASNLRNLSMNDFLRQITFSNTAPAITTDDITRLFAFAEKNFLKRPMSGVGLEVGAGSMIFVSLLALRESVPQMYGVELSKSMVELLAPKVTDTILGDKSN